MFRLRTTLGLSLLALVIGVAGTAWLSDQTDQWLGPPGSVVAHTDRVRAVLRRRPRSASAVPHAKAQAAPTVSPDSPVVDLPTLTPVDMPSLAASPWTRSALVDGRVVLHLSVDAAGRVIQAGVAQSSGDAGLDDRAIRTVQRWRFAVPADHLDGLRGQLVMRFDSGTAAL
ncbi:energy transducer TonB [Dyella sp. 20L07]|uniref:energy transducer TonB n=1 Tax=Dyella sp. 20L07 TaxID=3384240 RepID=UPI003D27FDC0